MGRSGLCNIDRVLLRVIKLRNPLTMKTCIKAVLFGQSIISVRAIFWRLICRILYEAIGFYHCTNSDVDLVSWRTGRVVEVSVQ